MNKTSLLEKAYCRPWLILPQAHVSFCRVAAEAAEVIDYEKEKDTIDAPSVFAQSSGVAVARISVSGVIGKNVGAMGRALGMYDLNDLEASLQKAEADQQVQGIVLDINSPGGTVTGVPEIAAMIREMDTPVIAYTSDMMASAAYWIASAADAIYASPSASVGSIGVYSAMLDASRYYDAMGLRVELFKSGKYKGMGMEGVPLTDEQRELIQSEVDSLYDWFASDVSRNRTISPIYMQGQSLLGKEAAEVDMVDAIGSFEDAVNEAEEMYEFAS